MHGCTNRTKSGGGKPRRYKRYICGNYNTHGRRAGCECNTVTESIVLGALLRKLEEEFLHPENIALLKQEIRAQEEAERDHGNSYAAALDRQIEALTQKISEGAERWLSAPAGLTGILGAKLEEWRRERDRLIEQRRDLQPPAPTEAELDEAVGTILAGLEMLKYGAEADPLAMKEVVRCMVERIELRFEHVPYGPVRKRSVLAGGAIRLRDELVISKPVPLGCPVTMRASSLAR
jgi:hypothetical protein